MPSRVASLFAVAASGLIILAGLIPLTLWPAGTDRGVQALVLIVGAVLLVAACVCAVGAAVVRRMDR